MNEHIKKFLRQGRRDGENDDAEDRLGDVKLG